MGQRQSEDQRTNPIQKQTTMNKDITPEIISDEQLEEWPAV
jgi:hypothetical protein